MDENTLLPFDLPAVARKKVSAAFDGGRITSDGGVMLLAQAERRLGIADQLARVIPDGRDSDRVVHLLPDILRARIAEQNWRVVWRQSERAAISPRRRETLYINDWFDREVAYANPDYCILPAIIQNIHVLSIVRPVQPCQRSIRQLRPFFCLRVEQQKRF